MDVSTYLSGGRLQRLCLKELRESLRDRRTVMTLVLMPILVYPLLSMALQRLLIGAAGSSPATPYVLGVVDPEQGRAIEEVLNEGSVLVEQDLPSPIPPPEFASNDSDAEGQEDATDLPTNRVKKLLSEIERFRLVQVDEGTLRESLEAGIIDVAIVQLHRTERQTREGAIWTIQAEMEFRQGDGHSQDAANLLRRLCQLINDQQFRALSQALGNRLGPIVQLRSIGVGSKQDPFASVASVIPLVLILMTITGAVYPAIDLTAGERERGTMEAMIATPAPRFALLLSKYVAVVTVAILTALANLFATWVTLAFGGLGEALFGEGGFGIWTLVQILPILAIFAAFFSSILLALCSFAKSFKEAQAYLIPVMLLSLAPGLVTLMPNVEFTSFLAVVPLLNVLLLSRDIMGGGPSLIPALIAIITTIGYGGAALVVAANLFGAANSTSLSQASWSDLIRRPRKSRSFPELGDFAIYLAFLFPALFVISSMGRFLSGQTALLMGLNALALAVLFVLLPSLWLIYQRVSLTNALGLSKGQGALTSPGSVWGRFFMITLSVVLLASTLWMFALEGVLLFKSWSLASFIPELEKWKAEWMAIPLTWILITQALIPAVAEEIFFRGFTLTSMQSRLRPLLAILGSSLLFALFHIISGNVLSLEKFVPTLLLGIALGYTAWTSGSILPGIWIHMIHNSIVLLFSRLEKEQLTPWLGNSEHLPALWLVLGAIAIGAAVFLLAFAKRGKPQVERLAGEGGPA
ncbi:CPBP family glutamic-type intramembrane protease [Pirellulaceae bacterium SH467]